jgi:hypothetical protein
MNEMLVNLLEETLLELKKHGKSEEDVEWVGSPEWGWFTWEDFKEVAKNVWYNDDYGMEEIALDLVVVGEDWWLERATYDGSEWWVFKTKPKKPKEYKKPRALCLRQVINLWVPSKLSDLNKEDE